MNTETENGIQMTLEMWMPEACPRQIVGASEHHAGTSLPQENEQDWTDDYFERAALVNSDSQLYKQAGNGVTVDVVYAIGKKIEECEEESLERFSKYMNKPKKGEE